MTFFDEKDKSFFMLSILINDNCTLSTYNDEEIQKFQEQADILTHDFFDNYFCTYITPYNKSRIKDEAYQKSNYINKYLKDIDFVDSDLNFAYNTILTIFDLQNWARVSGFFNIIEFKFKILDKTKQGISILEQSREFCVEMCDIFKRHDLEQEYDSRIYDYLIAKNKEVVVQKLSVDRVHLVHNYYQTHCIPKLKYDYKKLNEDLAKFIRGGTVDIYRSIIECHKLPENVQVLTMLSNSKADIARFAKCFDISFSEISIIFGVQVKENNISKCIGNEKTREFVSVLKKHNPEFSLNYL